jgi:lambda family phage tail tape measure protein
MAGNTYDIIINTNQAQQSINRLNTSLQQLDRASVGIGRAFNAMVTAASISSIAKLSDTVTSMNNRLRVTAKDQEDVNRQFSALAAIANVTRTPLEGIAAVYSKMMMSSETLGINQKQAAQYTTTLAQALKLTGSTTAETNSVLLQFSQGLSAGRFQGDELRAILEGNIIIVQALAKELKVSTQEIKHMGSEGKITAQVMLSALKNSAGEIAAAFAKMNPTISEAMTIMGTQSKVAFNEFEKNTQTGQNTAKAIESIAYSLEAMTKHIDTAIAVLGPFIKILGVLATFTIVGKLFQGFGLILGGLGTAIEAITLGFGRFGSIIKDWAIAMRNAITGGHSLRTVFTGLAGGVEIAFKSLGPFITAIAQVAAAIFAYFKMDSISEWFSSFSDANSEASKSLEESRKKQAEATIKGLDDTKKIAQAKEEEDKKRKKVEEQISRETAALNKLIAAYKDATQASMIKYQVDTDAIALSEKDRLSLEMTTDAFANYKSKIDELNADIAAKQATGSEADLAMIPKLQQGINDVTAAYNTQQDAIKGLTEARAKANEQHQLELYNIKSQIDQENKLQAIKDNINKVGKTEIEKQYYDIEAAAKASAKAEVEAEAARRNIKVSDMPAADVAAYYATATKGTSELQASTSKLRDLNREFSTGWKNAMNSYVDDATNAAKQAENIFSKTMSGMEDMIVNFAKTGKLEWKSFVASMLEELLRSQIKQQIASIFGLGTGATSASGGGGGLLGLLGFANGGLIPTNGPVLVGERGPEIIAGAAGRTVIPNHELGQGTGMTNITYNISAVDAMSFKQMIAADPNFIYAVTQQGAKSMPGVR